MPTSSPTCWQTSRLASDQVRAERRARVNGRCKRSRTPPSPILSTTSFRRRRLPPRWVGSWRGRPAPIASRCCAIPPVLAWLISARCSSTDCASPRRSVIRCRQPMRTACSSASTAHGIGDRAAAIAWFLWHSRMASLLACRCRCQAASSARRARPGAGRWAWHSISVALYWWPMMSVTWSGALRPQWQTSRASPDFAKLHT